MDIKRNHPKITQHARLMNVLCKVKTDHQYHDVLVLQPAFVQVTSI
jgi:hypothetical protein